MFDRIGVLRGSVVFFALLIAGLGLCSLADMGSQVIMATGALTLMCIAEAAIVIGLYLKKRV